MNTFRRGVKGMAGRRPKPTATHKLEGHKYKVAARNNEPKPIPIAPIVPDHISEYGKIMWKELVPKLEKLGLMTNIDGYAFEAACTQYGIYREAIENVNKKGVMIPDYEMVSEQVEGKWKSKKKKVGDKANPSIKVANDALTQFRQFCIEFGLTPASRSKLSIENVAKSETAPRRMLTGV
jgi:P27 family predicted phage terminase small subunit